MWLSSKNHQQKINTELDEQFLRINSECSSFNCCFSEFFEFGYVITQFLSISVHLHFICRDSFNFSGKDFWDIEKLLTGNFDGLWFLKWDFPPFYQKTNSRSQKCNQVSFDKLLIRKTNLPGRNTNRAEIARSIKKWSPWPKFWLFKKDR